MHKQLIGALARIWVCVLLVTISATVVWTFIPNYMLQITDASWLDAAFVYVEHNVIYTGSAKFYLITYTLGLAQVDHALFVNFLFAADTIVLLGPFLFAIGLVQIYPLSGSSYIARQRLISVISAALCFILFALSSVVSILWVEPGASPTPAQLIEIILVFSGVTFIYVAVPILLMIGAVRFLRALLRER